MAKAKPKAKAVSTRDDSRTSVPALVLFTDIRGFTAWSETTEVFIHLNRFVSSFLALVEASLPTERTFIKGLGDGAMIVQELTAEQYPTEVVLPHALGLIETIDRGFMELCRQFAREVGQKTDLRLGWGAVRGEVKKLERDYVGSNVNKAARLCDAARPFGIVLDQADFPDAGTWASPRFYQQTRRLSGLNEVEVWVTDDIFTQLVPREKLRENPEVHVAGLCVEKTAGGIRLLLAERSKTRRFFPGSIEGCGGQLRLSETFVEGVQRHFRLEMGIEVRVLEDYHCFYTISEPNHPVIPGVRFLCVPTNDGEPRSPNHSRVWWETEAEFRKLAPDRFVGNLKEEVIRLLDRYKEEGRRRR